MEKDTFEPVDIEIMEFDCPVRHPENEASRAAALISVESDIDNLKSREMRRDRLFRPVSFVSFKK